MANLKLSPEVASVLERSTISESSVVLPAGRLDPGLYKLVNKALALAGGKWDRRAQAHLFTSDPRTKLGFALSGEVILDEKQLFQTFYTPGPLAAMVAQMADVARCRVLEPSAGDGALADACQAERAREIVCVEIRPSASSILFRKGYLVHYQGDFLKVSPMCTFDRVVMNPPFARHQDAKHISHALQFVRPGGVLVSIMLSGKAPAQLDALCAGNEWEVLDLGPDAFKEVGTRVETSILTVRVG